MATPLIRPSVTGYSGLLTNFPIKTYLHMPPERKILLYDRSVSTEQESGINNSQDFDRKAMNNTRCTCFGASSTPCSHCQERSRSASSSTYTCNQVVENTTFAAAPSRFVPPMQQKNCTECDDHFKNIKDHFSLLKEEISVDHIIDGLHGISSLTPYDIEDITHVVKRRKKAEILLKRVLFYRAHACRNLIDVLRNHDYGHIVDKMHEDHGSNKVKRFDKYIVSVQTMKINFNRLAKTLKPEEVADKLIDYDVLTIDDHDSVVNGKTRKKMAETLLNLILKMSQQAQEIFVFLLEQDEVSRDLVREIFQKQTNRQQIFTECSIQFEIDTCEMMDTSDDVSWRNLTMTIEISDTGGVSKKSIESALFNNLSTSPMEFEEIVENNTDSQMEVENIWKGSVIIKLHPKTLEDYRKFREAANKKAFKEMLQEVLQSANLSHMMQNEDIHIKVCLSNSPPNSEDESTAIKQIKKAFSDEERSIDENRAFLLEELNPIPVVHLLKKSNILSDEQIEWINPKAKSDRRSQAEKLIQVLLNSDDHAIREFKVALEGSKQIYILEHINRNRCLACLRLKVVENESILTENLENCTVKEILDRCSDYPAEFCAESAKDGTSVQRFISFIEQSDEALIAFDDIMHATGEIDDLESSPCKTCGKRTSMNDETYLVKLKDNFEQIKEKIDATVIVNNLLERGAITYSDKSTILQQETTIFKNQLLLKKIIERGPKACLIFFGVLFDHSYNEILQPMEIVHPRSIYMGKTPVAPVKMEMPERSVDRTLMVAAIDFGTTYSGFAYSFRKDYGKDPLFIDTKMWTTAGLISLKTPTTLLLDPSKSFAAFGYDAEELYNQLLEDDIYADWYYFKQFKMTLHRKEPVNRKTMLKDSNGHSLPALDVFAMSISYLKQQLHAELDHKRADVGDCDILWVLTVPAIWDDAAKQFMREAAEMAGIPNNQLKLALEPEAASIYAKQMSVQRQEETKGDVALMPFSPGTKFMILDLGGGTIDITVREVLEDRTLKELHKASGGPWGGLCVNEEIFNFLGELLGQENLEAFKERHKPEYNDMESEIESKKRSIKSNNPAKVFIRCPGTLRDICESQSGKKLKDRQFEKYTNEVVIRSDKIRLDSKLAESLFDKAADQIIIYTRDILSQHNLERTKDIICVGGFAECDIVINKIRESFPERNVIVPQDAGLAVLKGAVLYGQNPGIVSSRVIRYTYGNAVHRLFWGDYDPPEKFVSIDGKPYCKDVFNKLAEAEQTYEVGYSVTEEVMPLKANMTKMSVHLYRSPKKNPRYVTDDECEYLGKITVDMPDTRKGLNRKVLVSLMFSDTEIKVQGKDETTGKLVETNLDLLSEKVQKNLA